VNEYVVIVGVDAAERRSELERVLGVRPTGAGCAADLGGDFGICGGPQVVRISLRGHIDQRFDRRRIGAAKLDRNALSVEAAALPVVEGLDKISLTGPVQISW
jgi:hypothetical protein